MPHEPDKAGENKYDAYKSDSGNDAFGMGMFMVRCRLLLTALALLTFVSGRARCSSSLTALRRRI